MFLLDELYSFRILVTMVTEVGHFNHFSVVMYQTMYWSQSQVTTLLKMSSAVPVPGGWGRRSEDSCWWHN